MTRRLAVLFLAMTIASFAFGQENVGSIGGTVVDSSGLPLPGVTVTASSPALIGTRTATTSEMGEYVIRRLPPGQYEVRSELSAFAPMVRPNIEVRVGQGAQVNFRMGIATAAETVVVTSEPPVIDLRSTNRNFTVDAKAVELIPISTAQLYSDLWVMAPGVRDQTATFSSTVRAPSINGAAVSQNKVFIDGIDVGDHINAGTTTRLSQSIIREVGISTGGFEAATGFGSGGLMNIVTRSGGNALSGGLGVVLAPKAFNDTNVPGTSPADINTYFPEVFFGGPILRDRLWYFVSDKYLHESRGIFNVNSYRTEVRSHEALAKLTWAPLSRHHFMWVYQLDRRSEDPSFGTAAFTYDATPVGKFGGYATGLNWDFQATDSSLASVLVSWFDKPNSTDGRNGSEPRTQFANAAGAIHTTSGNYDRDQTNEQTRPYISGSWTQSVSFAGFHDFKVSTEWYPRSLRRNTLRMNEVHIYRDSPTFGPQQLWRVRIPRPDGVVTNDAIDRGYAVALQDSWRPINPLTINAGVRYESNRTTVTGWDQPLLDYDSWSPRLGIAWQLNDETVIKGSASRFGEKFALDWTFTFFPNSVVFDQWESSQVNGVLDVFTQAGAPAFTTTRSISRPVTSVWEYVVGVQRQLPGKVAVDVSYVQRRYGHFPDSVDRNLILDVENRKFVGRVDPRFDALIDIVDTDRVKRSYRAVQVWLNRRLADRWQFNGSYTYAIDKQEGVFGYGTADNAALMFAYGDRAAEFFEEETGGRHNLKLSGSYTLPWNITAGVYYSKFSDAVAYDRYQELPPGTAAPRVTLSNGRVVNDPTFNPVRLVAPPSDKVGRSIGGTELVNLQLQKRFQFSDQALKVTALVFNLLNDGTYTLYGSTVRGNPNYNAVFGAQRPRAGQLSFGWEF